MIAKEQMFVKRIVEIIRRQWTLEDTNQYTQSLILHSNYPCNAHFRTFEVER